MSPGPVATPVTVSASAPRFSVWTWLVAGPLEDLFPPSGDFVGVEAAELKQFLPTMRREASLTLVLGITLSAVVYHLLPLLVIGVPLPAFWLPRSMRDRYARKIAKHPVYFIRQPIFLLKLVAGLAWGRLRQVREQLALPPYPENDPSRWRTS